MAEGNVERQWNTATRKRTTDDEDGRKAREIPEARGGRAGMEKKENRIKENKTRKESKASRNNYYHQLVSTAMWNFIPAIYMNHLYL